MIFFYFPFPNVCRDWSQNHSTVSADIKKLPSGGRIKRAGDDAAGMAVPEKRSDQIIRLETARKNVNDSLFQLAAMEDVLCRVLLNLAHMANLAEKVRNGACQDAAARENLQKDITSLKVEIDHISRTAGFNGIRLPDGFLSGGESRRGIFGAATASNTFVHVDQNSVLHIDIRDLCIFNIDISTHKNAAEAVELIKEAIREVSSIKYALKVIRNRLRVTVE